LVNIDAAKKINIKAALGGINFKNIKGQIITSGKFTDINTFDKPYNVIINAFNGAKKEGNDLLVELPPLSVVMLELK
jgi:alpha-N-arabinofuranosidase